MMAIAIHCGLLRILITDKYDAFIEQIAPAAIAACNKYGLYPSVCIAQTCIESSWGDNAIATYNLWVRKAVDGDNYVTLPTKEQLEDGSYITIMADFKVYQSFEEGFEDYCILLTEEPRYIPPLIFIGKDYESYVRAMAAVYATEKKYADMILDTVYANNLRRFDGDTN